MTLGELMVLTLLKLRKLLSLELLPLWHLELWHLLSELLTELLLSLLLAILLLGLLHQAGKLGLRDAISMGHLCVVVENVLVHFFVLFVRLCFI
jgi:hypothetical protein